MESAIFEVKRKIAQVVKATGKRADAAPAFWLQAERELQEEELKEFPDDI